MIKLKKGMLDEMTDDFRDRFDRLEKQDQIEKVVAKMMLLERAVIEANQYGSAHDEEKARKEQKEFYEGIEGYLIDIFIYIYLFVQT